MSDDGESRLYNFEYQAAMARAGKHMKQQGTTCVENCIVSVFKHLIHIFCFTIILSFAMMLYLVEREKTDNMGLKDTQLSQIDMLDYYVSHHPMLYGLNKIG